MKASILVVGICMVLSACTSMLLGGPSSAGATLGQDQRSAQQRSDDNAITTLVRQRIGADATTKGAAIDVSTHMRAVTLRGTVESFAIRDRAISIARSIENVRNVDNQIIVNSRR